MQGLFTISSGQLNNRCAASRSERGLPFRTSALRGVVPSKADIVSNLSKGGEFADRGGGGSKNPKFFGTSLMEAPK